MIDKHNNSTDAADKKIDMLKHKIKLKSANNFS